MFYGYIIMDLEHETSAKMLIFVVKLSNMVFAIICLSHRRTEKPSKILY